MRLNRVLSAVGGVVGAAALMVLSAGPGAAATNASGNATALKADVDVAGIVKVGPIALSHAAYPGGQPTASLLSIGLPAPLTGLVSADVLKAATTAKVENGSVHSSADLTNVTVNLGLLNPSLPKLHVDVLKADAFANAKDLHGDANIVAVSINGNKLVNVKQGQPIDLNALTGEAGLVGNLTAGAVTVTFNKQTTSADGNTLTVDALDIHVGGGLLDKLGVPALNGTNTHVDVVLSEAVATKGACENGGGGTNPTTGSSTSATTSGSATTTAGNGGGATTGNNGNGTTTGSGTNNLAYTGVSSVVPLTIGGIVLVVVGGGALYWTARRRKVANSSNN